MYKKLIESTVMVLEIEEPVFVKLKNNDDKTIKTRLISVATIEDDQLSFVQFRGESLRRLEDLGIKEGDIVDIGVYFHGSNKAGKKYNNICCAKINFVK